MARYECTVNEGLQHLVQLLPRVARGLRRRHGDPRALDGVMLGPRHGAALALLCQHDQSVGTMATVLDLNLATVSGLMADLESVAFVQRLADPVDRRRTIVRVRPGMEPVVDAWLAGATAPIVRALQQLSPRERAVLVKAVGFLDAELNASSIPRPSHGGAGAPEPHPRATLAPTGTEAAPKSRPEETL